MLSVNLISLCSLGLGRKIESWLNFEDGELYTLFVRGLVDLMLSCFFARLSVLQLWFPWCLPKPSNGLLCRIGGWAYDLLCQVVGAGEGACSAGHK